MNKIEGLLAASAVATSSIEAGAQEKLNIPPEIEARCQQAADEARKEMEKELGEMRRTLDFWIGSWSFAPSEAAEQAGKKCLQEEMAKPQ